MSFRIAVVQPQTHAPPGDEANVADAIRSIERCAGDGADFVSFPETYPGPWRMPAEFDPTGRLADAAAKHGVHAVAGTGVVDVSLDRVRELRAGRDGGGSSEEYGAKQGLLSEQWQRPDVVRRIYA